MKRIARGMIAAAVVAAAACSGAPTGSSLLVRRGGGDGGPNTQPSSTLAFGNTQSSSEQTPQSASGGAGSIAFTGTISTATPCWGVSASHAESTDAITVTVTANPSIRACSQVITYNNYQGTITGVEAGTYRMIVIHNLGGTATTAFNGTVVVE